MKNKLTLERAYELAVKKWECIVNNDGNEVYPYPKNIDALLFNCSYCEMFFNEADCVNCPLNLDGEQRGSWGKCKAHNHPYAIWSDDKTKANAQAVLDLIIKTKPV